MRVLSNSLTSWVTATLVGFLGLCTAVIRGSDNHTLPTVALDNATFIGYTDGLTVKFFGIPYARPPVSELRFSLPVASDPYSGTHTATEFGPSCPQQLISFPTVFPPELDVGLVVTILSSIFNQSAPQAEDCLSLNVWTPPGVQRDAGLPVVVWIHGGAYQVGSSNLYDGGVVVQRSIQLGEPIIFVSMNYRLSALGFLAGKEARDAGLGNLGLRDQRLSLKWVQRYIHAFGGDSAKVTIWGESAGAMSVATQMSINGGNTEGLFRGAYLQSGSLLLTSDMKSASQTYYDDLVTATGCSNASNSLDCLRHIPIEQLKPAMDASPSFLSYQASSWAWAPRVDGLVIPESLDQLAIKGSMAQIPVVIGACEDEGSAFALPSLNITTTEDLITYLSTYYFLDASREEISGLLAMYNDDPAEGCPFHTGTLNAATPQFKRVATIMTDLMFEAPRRLFLDETVGKQDVWAYLYRRNKAIPILGSSHLGDLLAAFHGSDVTDHLIHFVNYLDPNGPSNFQNQGFLDMPHAQAAFHAGVTWPKYDKVSKTRLVYSDGPTPVGLLKDIEREKQVRYMLGFLQKHPIL